MSDTSAFAWSTWAWRRSISGAGPHLGEGLDLVDVLALVVERLARHCDRVPGGAGGEEGGANGEIGGEARRLLGARLGVGGGARGVAALPGLAEVPDELGRADPAAVVVEGVERGRAADGAPAGPDRSGRGHQVAGRPAVAGGDADLGEQRRARLVDPGVGGLGERVGLAELGLVRAADAQGDVQRNFPRELRLVGLGARRRHERQPQPERDQQTERNRAPHSYLSASIGSRREALRAG